MNSKKTNEFFILLAGTLLLALSYWLDAHVSSFFENAAFPIIDAVLGVISNFGIVIILMLILPSIILYRKNRKNVYSLWVSFAVSIMLAFIIKITFLRQRPIENFTFPLTNIVDYSFPSMHAMAAFSLLPLLIIYLPKHRLFWAIFAFLVAFSRIYFRFHFLSDVVFGALAGYFIGRLILTFSERKVHGNGKV